MASRLMHCRMNRLWEPRLLLYWSLRRESSLLDGQMTIWLLASKDMAPKDMQELLNGSQRHYLFMSYRLGTLLIPEKSVYERRNRCRKGWLECGRERPDLVRAYAVRVDRRMPGRVRGDVVLLDYANHTMDVEMNTDDGIDGEWKAERHLRSLHAARKGYVPISPDGYLQELASAYMARACPYRAGFQRICNADARALLNEEVLPVFQLNRPDYGRLLCTDELKRMGRDEVFRYPDGRQQRL